uniref:Uncharacterized protein n=1 Tax=Arundo donax TaxID=35708 RepID=A0A0A8YSD1_ARUDO
MAANNPPGRAQLRGGN